MLSLCRCGKTFHPPQTFPLITSRPHAWGGIEYQIYAKKKRFQTSVVCLGEIKIDVMLKRDYSDEINQIGIELVNRVDMK